MPAMPAGRVRAAAIAGVLTGAVAVLGAAPAGAQDPTSPYTAPDPTSPYTAPAPTPAPASPCPNAEAAPTAVSAAAYGEAVRCLASVERAAAGLRPLRTNRSLRIAAVRHTSDMVARRYFEHVGPRGDTLFKRVRATGYTKARSWKLGEVLAWGTGERATPAGVVAAWMASPEHHAILMDPSLRDVGIGLATQVAATGAPGVTVTGDLGRRG